MLHLLKEYAKKHDIAVTPGFKSKRLSWCLSMSKTGKYLGLIPLGEYRNNKYQGIVFDKCPYEHLTSAGKEKCQFLYEKASVLFPSYSPDDKNATTKNVFFQDLLKQASSEVDQIKLVIEFLNSKETIALVISELNEKRIKPHEELTFNIDGKFLLESEELLNWWAENYRKVFPKDSYEHSFPSLVSGDNSIPAKTHPMIGNLSSVGAQGRAALSSFNHPSFCSYNLPQSVNSPVSEEDASTYTSALQFLVDNSSLFFAGMRIAYWFKKEIPKEYDMISQIFASIEESEVGEHTKELNALEHAKEVISAIKKGKKADLLDNHYYALTISGVESRIMVRDWMEGQFEDLANSVKNWFEDIEICIDHETKKLPKIDSILDSILLPRKNGQKYEDWIKPIGATRVKLWQSAIKNLPIPREAVAKALHRIKAEITDKDKARSHARMGLLKAYLIRNDRSQNKESFMDCYLNADHPEAAYQCGRLLAVLSKVQLAGSPQVGVGIAQRYYSSASATPALILGKLTSLSQHHLGKLESKGRAKWFENQIAEIWCKVKDIIPATLTLEQQSLFALGYYQQMASIEVAELEEKQEVENE